MFVYLPARVNPHACVKLAAAIFEHRRTGHLIGAVHVVNGSAVRGNAHCHVCCAALWPCNLSRMSPICSVFISWVPAAQVAAAKKPVDLGKRQRRKVVYNEVELGRAKASDGSSSSSSGSEFEADDAAEAEDEDGSGSGSGVVEEGVEGKRVRTPNPHQWRLVSLASMVTKLMPMKVSSTSGSSSNEHSAAERKVIRIFLYDKVAVICGSISPWW